MAAIGHKNILLLTATITPPAGVVALARTDPRVRLKDYEAALEFYAGLVGREVDEIVFAENSLSDVSSLQAIARRRGIEDRVEFVVVDGLDYPVQYSRSYGEFRLVRRAMTESRILANVESAMVWKVTGRYVVRNLSEIIRRRPDCDLYVNCRNLPSRLMDFFLYGFNAAGYRAVLMDFEDHVREDATGGPGEIAGRTVLDARLSRARIVRRFRVVPCVDGIRGYDNSRYLASKGALKLTSRAIANRVAPWLWI
jgi:hypothetical protein